MIAPAGFTRERQETKHLMPPPPKFNPGTIVATPGALEAIRTAGDVPSPFVERHLAGDWGDLDEHDRLENEISLQKGFRLMSSYHLKNGTQIWIITEADRSSTTILLPDEY